MSENNQTNSKNSNAGRGGSRTGAGRKPGSVTKRTREIAEKAMDEGITPLEFMLQLMRSEPPEGIGDMAKVGHKELQFEAAKAALPYMHPRLAAIELTGKDGGPVQFAKVERTIVDPLLAE